MSHQKPPATNRFRIRDHSTNSKSPHIKSLGSIGSSFNGQSPQKHNSPSKPGNPFIPQFSPVRISQKQPSILDASSFLGKDEKQCLHLITPHRLPSSGNTRTGSLRGKVDLSESTVQPTSLRKSSYNAPLNRAVREHSTRVEKTHRVLSVNLTNLSSKSKLAPAVLNKAFLEKAGIQDSRYEEEQKGGLMSLSRYRVGKTLGEGAYSIVCEAVDRETLQKVALKLYNKEKVVKNELKLSNLAREIKVLRALQHPNIIKLFGFFETDRQVVLVMEHFDGKTLGEVIRAKEGNFLPESESRIIAKGVVSALHHCHRLNVMHRDIKMDNILVSNNLSVKLIDFGFSVMVTGSSHRLDLRCGTSYYMPPEIVNNSQYLGVPADIWSLGVVLFTLTNGFYPFGTPKMKQSEIYKEISSGALRFRKHLSFQLQDLIKHVLKHDPLSRLSLDQILEHPWMTFEEESSPDSAKHHKRDQNHSRF